ncbi:glycyl radical protein [Desulfovibrio sp. TomC]|uniref:glycyl radical protein n=1 Tax=Desulfovibrio sp. TomC TaxID=1562888 RepID=UPI000573DD22|nr:glycyl radical protein [Desulfovibrio sp. TomC]KHK01733.1 Pyruvate formate-lyase [Desulfovibrio sp. TomC]
MTSSIEKQLLSRIDVLHLPGPTPRVEAIRERFISLTPEICVERAQYITESYKETEDQPIHIRRAKALEKILGQMTIFIQPDEIIVGNQCTKPRAAPVFPEFSCKWLEDELDRLEKRTGDVFLISEAKKATLRALFPYWNGKTTNELATALMPQAAKEAQKYGVFTVGNYYFNGVGHISVDYAKVLDKGLDGIIAEARSELAGLDMTNPEHLAKITFLDAVIIANQAVIAFAKRFSDLAAGMAAKEADPTRKAELLEIARVCAAVPASPAQTFAEALQSFWFIQLVLQIESNGHSISPMRFDQYLFPYLLRDKDLGIEKAQELLDLLFIKFNEINKVRDEGSTKAFGGYPMFQNLIVGGVDREGEDATNPLSYMCLQATANTRLYQPSISIRVHSETPRALYEKAAEVTRLGLGMPAYYNDRFIIPGLLSRGLTREDARDYGIIGCVEPQVGGKTEGWHDAAFFNIAKVLELTLNNGVDPLSGERLGPATGDLTTFATYDDLMAAYRKQMEYSVRLLVVSDNAVDVAHGQRAPLPFLSSLVDDCIAKGKSLQEGGAHYNFTGPQGVGVANVADSLAALRKLVYEDKALSLGELKAALASDFAGVEGESLRQMLVNRAPKYGNDEPYADEIAHEGALIYCKEVEKYANPRGGRFQPGLYPVSANVPLGTVVGATPDGRKAGTPLADGVSPVSGMDHSGPTASVKSVTKLDHVIASNGTLLNMKFHPSALKDGQGISNLIAVTETLFNGGGTHIQYNVISKDTLTDAQMHPDNYRGLVVRVAGYSAFFTSLDRSIQDDIISRTEQMF